MRGMCWTDRRKKRSDGEESGGDWVWIGVQNSGLSIRFHSSGMEAMWSGKGERKWRG